MATLDEITKEKERLGEALARVEAQREKLTSQLSELEAAERVLTRYSKGTQAKRTPSAKTQTTATKAAGAARPGGRGRTTTAKPAGGSAPHRPLVNRSLPWQTAKRSRKSPRHARGLVQTMSAWPLRGTSGLAVSKSATASFTLRSRRGPCNAPRCDTGSKKRASTASEKPAAFVHRRLRFRRSDGTERREPRHTRGYTLPLRAMLRTLSRIEKKMIEPRQPA